MVYISFLLFVPTYMSQVWKASDALAAQAGSIYSLGCLLAVTVGSSLYAQLVPRRQAGTVWVLTGLATLASLGQLLHVRGLATGMPTSSPAAALGSLFVWGASSAIPFYLPPSIYALQRGGQTSSATIADLFDVGGFGLLAIFNAYVGSIDHVRPEAWTTTFVVSTLCALVSWIALPVAILRQSNHKESSKA